MKDGLILINKPQNITSFSAVAAVKRKLSVKCGHSGTLDPLATGLLPVMCGKATKLCQYLTEGDKKYRAVLKFGIATDTYDITGQITQTSDKRATLDEINSIVPKFIGKIKQVPPAYSAIKVGGTALYKLAREGKAVNAPIREIEIYSIDILDYDGEYLTMDVYCSKGTYIRSLCNDLAQALGTVGTMSELTRTQSGKWKLCNAVDLDTENLEEHIIPIDTVLAEFPEFYAGAFYSRLLTNGCAIDVKKLKNLPDGICRVYDSDKLLGLGSVLTEKDEQVFKIITHL